MASRRPNRRKTSPLLTFLLVATAIAAAAGIALRGLLGLHWLVCYLVAVNVAIFLLYTYDKAVSGRGGLRVPESLLQGFALAGGTPAAFLAQRALRHKRLKRPFRSTFVWVMVVQLVALSAWVWYDWTRS